MAVFRVEKTKDFTIMSNHHLRNTELSLKAKGLLSLMLSLPEDWDYTTKGLAHICKDGVDSITTALKELERHGYLTRQRLRYDNGQLGDIEYTIHEQPVSTENIGLSPKRENPRQVKPEQAKPKQAEPEQENPAQLNTNPLKTKKSKKDKSITYPSIYPAEPEAANRTDGMDRIELIEAYREIIKENIEYDLLVLRYGRERLDEALELMLEVILSKRPYIRIAGDDFPREIVKSRFLKINAVKRHPVICLVLLLLLLVIFLITSLFSTFSNIGTGGLGSLAASTYLADDQDINQAELTYTEWETDLQMEIDRVESDRPGYDEYRYNLGAIEHDPYVLMGYLTSAYQGFTYDEVESVLRQLFQEQYTLSFSEETEIRYRTETSVDPETGEETQEEVPYEWRILNVKLTVTPLENLVVSRMNADQKEICEILLQTKGNRQYVKNVFGTNWLPYVTSYYGYRVHPISGEKNYHTGVDIGMPEGTEILAGHDGTVTLAGNAGGYGLCVAIEGEAYEGHTLTTKYGHCSQILVSAGQEVKAGDVIAKVGNTGNSTGAHLHLEVLVDGQYLNPLYFADTGDTSERHLPEVGSGGTGNYFDYDIPPEALADEQFAAMMAEAEKYLGYPYVWGGASPSTSFDCSGYVSWVINNCGVGWNFGRLTADGLLGVCTPVSSADAKPGDLIFFQGTYNTSGASHVGIYVGNGMMIHCGDPISYANINTSYWQQHFYTFGRLP